MAEAGRVRGRSNSVGAADIKHIQIRKSEKRPRADSTSTCMICDDSLDEVETKLKCEGCENWLCLRCSKVPLQVFQSIRSGLLGSFAFMCPCCKTNLPHMRNLTKSFDQMRNSNEDRLNQIEERLLKMEDTIDDKIDSKIEQAKEDIFGQVSQQIQQSQPNLQEVKADIIGQVTHELQPRIDKAIKTAIESGNSVEIKEAVKNAYEEQKKEVQASSTSHPISPGTHQKQVDQALTTLATELQDREKRRNNFVIYNATESNSQQKDERIRHDAKLLVDICTESLKVNVSASDIESTTRIGKPREDAKPRPLIVAMKEYELKDEIFKNLPKLRNTIHNMISIAHDMTKMERAQNSKTLAEAKKLTQEDKSGLWMYKVRGPPGGKKVVKVRKFDLQERKEGTKEPAGASLLG